MSLSLRALATKTSWAHSSSTLLAQGEWVPASMAMRSEDSEAKRRLKASGVVLSLPSSISSPLSESRRQWGRSICRLCPIRLSSVDALCYYPWWADPPLWAVRARQPLQTPRVLRRGSAFSSHLRRILLPRTRVNDKGLQAYALLFRSLSARRLQRSALASISLP